MEIQALKHLFDLPIHTPTPAILYSLGIPYTCQRLDKKQLIYLHRILKRCDQHWTKLALNHLNSLNIGWGKSINECLKRYDLPDDYSTIRAMTIRAWTKLVSEKVEIKNKQRLLNDCYKTNNNILIPKTKTAHLIDKIKSPTYTRNTQDELLDCTKHETKTIIIARFGMLECGSNFKGSSNPLCKTCKMTDNESHRLNECTTRRTNTPSTSPLYINFDDIYSNNRNTLSYVMKMIEQIWNTKTAHGSMLS